MSKILKFGNKIIAGFIILATVIAVFIPSIDVLDGAKDYLIHFLFFLIVSGFIGLIVNNRTIIFTSFGCAMLLALFLKNASNTDLKDPKVKSTSGSITVAHINLSLVTDVVTIQDIMNRPDLDVISFQEYTPDWANIIPQLAKSTFTHKYEDVRIDLYGKAVFSKFIIDKPTIKTYGDIPNAELSIEKNGQVYKLISVYMVPALDKVSKETAKIQFDLLKKDIVGNRSNILVLGEFNQVYWSHDIIAFRNQTNLLNSRRDINPSTIKMPYDHIFHSSGLESFNFVDITDRSNNHLGCMSSFQIRKIKGKFKSNLQ